MCSKSLCVLIGKLHSTACLLKVSTYAFGVLGRLGAMPLLQTKCLGELPVARHNLWGFEAEHNFSTFSDSRRAKRTILMDLRALLLVENGDGRSTDAIHHYRMADGGRPFCSSLEETKQNLLNSHTRLYLGAAWPVPALDRFTHTGMILKMLCTAVTHHCLMSALVEPYSMGEGGAPPSLLESGREMSDFQTNNWAVARDTRHHLPIMFRRHDLRLVGKQGAAAGFARSASGRRVVGHNRRPARRVDVRLA